MEATRTRSAVFLIQYAVLLIAALVWVQFELARRRMGGDPSWFHLLIGAALCYLVLRAYLVLRKKTSRKQAGLWSSLELAITIGAVYLSGGINGEVALLYFRPIATSSVQRLPRRVGSSRMSSSPI